MPQQWNPSTYATDGQFVPELGESLIDLLAPVAGEKILDLGCGNGDLTEKIAATGATVLGVDADSGFVEATKARGLEARQVDGQKMSFDGEFDAVFSNAAMHWMKDGNAVIEGVKRALVPNGRFIAELGGQGNVSTVVAALEESLASRNIGAAALNPWYFPGEEYRKLLEKSGFGVSFFSLFERPTPLPGDISNWLELFAGSFLDGVAPEQRAIVIEEVRESVKPQLLGDDNVWRVDYVRLRFAAQKT